MAPCPKDRRRVPPEANPANARHTFWQRRRPQRLIVKELMLCVEVFSSMLVCFDGRLLDQHAISYTPYAICHLTFAAAPDPAKSRKWQGTRQVQEERR